MPTPIAPRIILAQNARVDLQTLVRAHTTPQSLALRARMMLRAAAVDQPTNLQSAASWDVPTSQWANGDDATWHWASPVCKMSGARGAHAIIAPPTRVQVISVASTLPHDHDRTVTRWTLNEIVATLLEALETDSISRSSIWRILQDVDLKPHKSEYWLNSHDEDFDAKAQTICQLYAKALDGLPARSAGDLLR